MKKYGIKITQKDNTRNWLQSLSEYRGSSSKPLRFETKEEAEVYAYDNELREYIVEELSN